MFNKVNIQIQIMFLTMFDSRLIDFNNKTNIAKLVRTFVQWL